MSNYSGLPLHVLRRIFACFYHELEEPDTTLTFRKRLPLAAVCHIWRELTLQYVYSTAHFELHKNDADAGSETQQPKYKYVSNIGLISRHYNNSVKCMVVRSLATTLDFSSMIHTLDTLGFSSVYWPKVALLEIWGFLQNETASNDVPDSKSSDMLATWVAEYFVRHMPNILHLSLRPLESPRTISQLMFNKLANSYMGQLRSLITYFVPILFDRHSFSSGLTKLNIQMSSEATYQLPKMLASSLQILILHNIPHTFSWSSFITDIRGHAIFTNLREFELDFAQPLDDLQESTDAGRRKGSGIVTFDTNGRQFHFPTLESLTIIHSPYNNSTLYSMFAESPQQSVEIRCSLKSLDYIDTRILSNASNIGIDIDDFTSSSYDDFILTSRRLLSCTSAVKNAELWINKGDYSMVMPERISWINLETLHIGANIYFSSAIKIVTQLPKLHDLYVWNILNYSDDDDIRLQAVLSEDSSFVAPLNTSIKTLWISGNSDDTKNTSLGVICYLVLLIGSLESLNIPGKHVPGIKDFISNYAKNFPHLLSIDVNQY